MVAAAGIMLSMGSGMALAATINGTDREDTLSGTKNADVTHGLKSNDTIKGLAENDRLYGDENKDVLIGSRGKDLLSGGVGDDRLYGGPGNDRIYSAFDGGDADRVMCGDGVNDSATIDQFDVFVDGSCENVKVVEAAVPAEPETV